METGHRGATQRDVRDLCDLYDVGSGERERMMQLAVQGKQPGWWQHYDLDFSTYVGLEAAATTVKYYQSTIVPGLLQTTDYARAMLDATVPSLSTVRIAELLEVKRRRQQVHEREQPLPLWAVLDEAVLHRVVGGAAVMEAQLDRLVGAVDGSDVTLQIIPFSAGAHAAMDSTFNILEFPGPVSSVVYVEGLVGWVYLDRPADIDRYRQVFESLCVLAMTPQESIELVIKIRNEYKHRRICQSLLEIPTDLGELGIFRWLDPR